MARLFRFDLSIDTYRFLRAASDWRQPMQWKIVEFGDMTDAQLAVTIILLRLEQPYGSTLTKLDALRRKLAEVGLTAEEWNIFVSCLCMEGFMIRKHTANATNSTHAGRLPVPDGDRWRRW